MADSSSPLSISGPSGHTTHPHISNMGPLHISMLFHNRPARADMGSVIDNDGVQLSCI